MLAQTQRIRLDIPVVFYDLCYDIGQITGEVIHPERIADYTAKKVSHVMFESPDTQVIPMTQLVMDGIMRTHQFSRSLPNYLNNPVFDRVYKQYLNDLTPFIAHFIDLYRNRCEYASVINSSFIFYRTNLHGAEFQSPAQTG